MVDNTGAIFYYLNDHLGSLRVIVKADGTIQDRYNRYCLSSHPELVEGS